MQKKRLKTALAIIFYVLFCCYAIAQQQTDSFKIHFDLNDDRLSPDEKGHLDSLLYTDVIQTKDKLLIIGYADYLGDAAHNDSLSSKRAHSVKDYLLKMGMQDKDINLCIGKGEVNRDVHTPDGYASDRYVSIVRLANKTFKPAAQKPVPQVIKTPKTERTIKGTYIPQLEKMEIGETLQLKNIYFYTGRHTIKEESYKELDNLYNALIENPTLVIQIEGHICCVINAPDAVDEDVSRYVTPGDTAEMKRKYGVMALSTNRAMFIYEYLVNRGIDAERLSYKGFGRSKPIVKDEQSIDDEDKNKRVEIRILEK